MAARRLIWLIAAALGLSLALGVAWYWSRAQPAEAPAKAGAPQPPVTISPYLNTRPGVAYLGDVACVSCHRQESEFYRQHAMGRSMFLAENAPPVEAYAAGANNPFQTGPFRFQVIRRGGKLIHKEWCQDAAGKVVAQFESDMAYAVGSGAQARSYLYQRDGFLFESPITWFSRKAAWDVSPGFEKVLEHFQRPITAKCVYCHCQEARAVAGTVNRYDEPPFGQLAIGCERCHGPGELHVAARKRGAPEAADADMTIVNPRRLAPALRDAVCEQCHLQGEETIPRRDRLQTDYRPGLPLHEYVSVFVRAPELWEPGRIVGHVEQMHQSTCFRKSGGEFGCLSCHHPHRAPPPAEKVSFYRRRCLVCHSSEQPAGEHKVRAFSCALPAAQRKAKDAADNCVACHMPHNPSSNVNHLAVTDHRVLRRPERPPNGVAARHPEGMPLLAFHRALLDPNDPELRRDLGLGLMSLANLAHEARAGGNRDYLTGVALPLLEEAAARDPNDVFVLVAQADALFFQGRAGPAFDVLQDALSLAPDREQTLIAALRAAEHTQQLDLAEKYGQRLTEKYPHYAGHHHALATILVKRDAWERALQAARAAVAADPFHREARAVFVTVLLETGDRAGAQREFDVLGVIDPAYQNRLRPWFARRLAEMVK